MVAVDTNVLVRLITRDDARQVAAAEAFVAAGAWVSLLVLMEATWVLSTVYGLAPGEIATAVKMLLDHERVTLDSPEVVSEALARYRKHPAIGFSDCLILEAARRVAHLPLGTFDKDLAKLPGARRIS